MYLDTIGSADTEAFEPTQPLALASLRGSAAPEVGAGAARPVLSSAMRIELQRLAATPQHFGALAVLAASVRHAQPIAVHMRTRDQPFLLSIFPRERLYQCEHRLSEFDPNDLALLRLARVEPVLPLLMGDAPAGQASGTRVGPLGLMLWQMALHGHTNELLPEIAGPASYRLTPDLHLAGLPLHSGQQQVMHKLRGRPSTVHELAHGTPLGPSQVRRLLNALYLQMGLIVTRTGSASKNTP